MRDIKRKQSRPQGPVPSSLAGPDKAAEHPVLHLQHSIGNQAVRQILHSSQAGPTVQRQPAPPAAAPQSRRWKDVFADLRHARRYFKDRVPALVQELLDVVDVKEYDLDILSEAMGQVEELTQEGNIPAADRLLNAVNIQFQRAYLKGQDLPTGGMLTVGQKVMGDPGVLIGMGQKAARAGEHGRAFKLFGVAIEILSYMALSLTEKGGSFDPKKRSNRYWRFQRIYNEMREIYRFYFVLEAEALAAGNAAKAAEARNMASKLHGELKHQLKPLGNIEAEIAEFTVLNPPGRRPLLQIDGSNHTHTDLSELPGHPFPADVIASPHGQEVEKLEQVQSALIGQAGFQAEIAREPAIQKAFGNDPVDLNDTAKRQKVWSTMYGVFKARGAGALSSLMELMGRYLKHHTHHTSFNVRDFGDSYLTSEMPADLTGRLVRDCGVYALTVAWEVFQTVKAGDPSLKVKFTLATLLDHIVLVITDETAQETYLVNNELITKVAKPAPGSTSGAGTPPPKAPVMEEEVAKQYLLVRSLPYLVSPVNLMNIGSTADAAGSFKGAAWTRYLASTQHMAKVKVDFTMLELFSIQSEALDKEVNTLAPSASDPGAISAWLTQNWPSIASMLVRFEQIGTQAFKGLAPPAGSRNAVAFRWPGSNHPVLRIALILLRLRKLGQPLTADQQKYLAFFETAFKDLMDKSRGDAEAGRF